MEEVTRKRLGRPRKIVAVANAATEGADLPSIDDGVGDIGPEGTATQAESERPSAGLSWDELVTLVTAKQSITACIACVSHPDAVGEILHANQGNMRVVKGDAFYQYSTGEKVAI